MDLLFCGLCVAAVFVVLTVVAAIAMERNEP